MKRKKNLIIKLFLILFLIGATFLFLIWWAFLGGAYFMRVPSPKIQYGEFPFQLTYELDGEIMVMEDTILCEFDGFRVVGEAGKYRKWKISLKNGSDAILSEFGGVMITLLNARSGAVTDTLYFHGGTANYYMGDASGIYVSAAQELDKIGYMYFTKDGTAQHESYSAEIAWRKFKLRLISWEAAPPIENTFGDE